MKRNVLFASCMRVLLCGCAALCAACGDGSSLGGSDEEPELNLSSMRLVWSDEFNGSAVSTADWTFETGTGDGGWGNGEVQTYTDDGTTAIVSNGTLKITALKNSSGNWTSARMITQNKHKWTYGYFEARMKLPPQDGTWPAFWMMPNDSAYGTWPNSGEIDIMEHSAYLKHGSESGLNYVFSTLHAFSNGAGGFSLANEKVSGATSGFHTYGVWWTDKYICAYYDGKPVGKIFYRGTKDWTDWPFDKDFFIILNLAMGGNLGGRPSDSDTQAVFEIDYVRVYQ